MAWQDESKDLIWSTSTTWSATEETVADDHPIRDRIVVDAQLKLVLHIASNFRGKPRILEHG